MVLPCAFSYLTRKERLKPCLDIWRHKYARYVLYILLLWDNENRSMAQYTLAMSTCTWMDGLRRVRREISKWQCWLDFGWIYIWLLGASVIFWKSVKFGHNIRQLSLQCTEWGADDRDEVWTFVHDMTEDVVLNTGCNAQWCIYFFHFWAIETKWILNCPLQASILTRG